MGRKSEQNGTVYLRKWKTNRELKGNNDKNFRFNFEMYTYHARRGPLKQGFFWTVTSCVEYT